MTPGELYGSTRTRISAFVSALPDTRVPVPGCPGWTVHDVVAHATGITTDILAGNLDGATTDPWTQAQVDLRRDRPTAEVLAEWAANAARFDAMIDEAPKGLSRTLLIDLVTHEYDVRGAVGDTGGRDDEPYAIARKGYCVGLAYAVKERGLPALLLEAPEFTFLAGDGEPAATMRTKDAHEIFRALAGRRSRAQVLAYEWQGDPEPYLPVVNHFGPLPETDVVE